MKGQRVLKSTRPCFVAGTDVLRLLEAFLAKTVQSVAVAGWARTRGQRRECAVTDAAVFF